MICVVLLVIAVLVGFLFSSGLAHPSRRTSRHAKLSRQSITAPSLPHRRMDMVHCSPIKFRPMIQGVSGDRPGR
jgi:hypothetical protein